MDTLISGATVVTMNEGMEVLLGGFVGITDGKIVYLSKEAPKEKPAAIVDGSGMVLLPGLINCHTHLAQTALRNFFDDLSPKDSLEALLRFEAKMDSKAAEAAVTMGVAECLRMGITSVSDLYYYPEATAKVLDKAGIKGNLALSAYRFEDQNEDFDFESDPQCQELQRLVEKWHGHDRGRIRMDAGIYAEYTSNYRLWEGMADFAREKGLGFHLHLSQTESEREGCLDRTGLAPAELLNCHGVFNNKTCAVGCGYLTDQEIALLGKKHVSAVLTPEADALKGRRTADVVTLLKAGMNVALGSGGVEQVGSVDLFEEMRFAAAASRKANADATPLPASALLMLATTCAARAQGREAECGMIRVGMDADLILVDFTAPHLMPCHNVLNGLVYSARGSDVAMTMVRGKILYENGKFPTLDLPGAVEALTGYAIPKLFSPSED